MSEVEIGGGGGDRPHEVAPVAWQDYVAQEALAAQFPRSAGGGVWFSESLGQAIVDPDPSIWLAIIGGGRILGSLSEYSKIAPLPLADFGPARPDACPIYVLAALPEERTSLQVSISPLATPPLGGLPPLPPRPRTFPGVHEVLYETSTPGQWLVTLTVGDQPAYTMSAVTMANRCTLMTVALDDDEQLRIGQYVLPIGHLVPQLDPFVQQNLRERNPLRDVYTLSQLSRAFRKRRRLAKEFSVAQVEELLYNKWVDPIGATLAAYECVRRNNLEPVKVAVGNLRMFFREMPDTEFIAQLAKMPDARPQGVPLFLDGLRALRSSETSSQPIPKTGSETTLPIRQELLDYTGPWTAWRAAFSAR